jgi:hypothetical protein
MTQGRILPADEKAAMRIEAGRKVCATGGPKTPRALKVFERAVRAESFSAGSRATLDQLYRGCPDESCVMWLGQIIARPAKLSPTEAAARDRAIAHAHEWATKSGYDFAIGVPPDLD